MAVDPLVTEYPNWSAYNYTFNNPLRFIDPDGRGVLGGQIGFEIGAGLGVSVNISVTYDTRGGKFNLLGSFGRGVVVGASKNMNIGVMVGDTDTRTEDLIGEGVENSFDISFALKGGGYAQSEGKDDNGNPNGRVMHIFSWSPGLGAKASQQNTTTIDLVQFISSIFNSSEDEKDKKKNSVEKDSSERDK